MSDKTSIEWTRSDDGSPGTTWNPITGCAKVSEGCGMPRWDGDQPHGNCYAETFAERFRGVPGHAFEQGFDLQLRPERLGLPLRWRKPRRVFVNSMSDLFFDARKVPDDFIAQVFATMAATPQHTYQILTKRPGRMASLLGDEAFPGEVAGQLFALAVGPDGQVDDELLEWAHNPWEQWPLPNVWLGVSVETQKWAAVRLPKLAQTPARVRFVSCEPLLGPLDLREWLGRSLDWVIVGGESGPGARPMHPNWARDLRDQAIASRVAFFYKQWGHWVPESQDPAALTPSTAARAVDVALDGSIRPAAHGARGSTVTMHPVGKKAAGRLLDGRTWDEFPTVGARR